MEEQNEKTEDRILQDYSLSSASKRQIERINKKVKKYLQKYISHYQDNWPDIFSMLKYIYNMKRNEDRTYISYQIVYGKIPTVTIKKRIEEIQVMKR